MPKLYRNISILSRPSLDGTRSAWEQDLGPLSDDQWDSILRAIHKTSLCARHCLIQFKIVHWAHMSKTKLASFYPSLSPICDKCKTNDGTLFHMYWMCPKLQIFWNNVFNTLSKILGRNVVPSPTLALFGLATGGNPQLTFSEQHMVGVALFLARRAILLRWRDAASPTLSQWLQDIMTCLKLEMLRLSIGGSEKNFYKT